MRAILAAIFAILTFTALAYADELPMPWELPHDQLGPLLKEQYLKAESLEKFRRGFVRPGKFGNEILCVSDSDLIHWRDGTQQKRQALIKRGRCFHEPVGWYLVGYFVTKSGALPFNHDSIWLINPAGTVKVRHWTLAAAFRFNQPSCEEEAGLKQANIFRKQCLQVSSATHPPCNVKNTCTMMIDHIDYMCHRLKDDVDTDENWRKIFETKIHTGAKFCVKYVPNW